MERPPRITEPGLAYHLLNRRAMRPTIFEKDRNEEALKVLRQSARHSVPLGADRWKARIAARLGLQITLRPRGRPRNRSEKSS